MMSDKLRAAALAALETLDCGGRNYSRAAHILRAALEEPAIKESLTVAEQKPVGQLQETVYGRGQVLWFNKPADTSMLYTAPPRREWVGLTHDEVNLIYAEPQTHVGQYAKAIESKLREKNT